MFLNKAIFCGNAAADPEVKEIGGKKAASFRIGITEKYKDTSNQMQEKTEWINIIAWGKTAEVAEKYVSKGSTVFVEGKLQNRQWNDQNGNKRYVCEVVATNVQAERRRSPRTNESLQDMPDDLGF